MKTKHGTAFSETLRGAKTYGTRNGYSDGAKIYDTSEGFAVLDNGEGIQDGNYNLFKQAEVVAEMQNGRWVKY